MWYAKQKAIINLFWLAGTFLSFEPKGMYNEVDFRYFGLWGVVGFLIIYFFKMKLKHKIF